MIELDTINKMGIKDAIKLEHASLERYMFRNQFNVLDDITIHKFLYIKDCYIEYGKTIHYAITTPC